MLVIVRDLVIEPSSHHRLASRCHHSSLHARLLHDLAWHHLWLAILAHRLLHLSRLLHLDRHLEHIHVLWILHGIQEHINLCLIQASLLEPILASKQVEAHLGDLLQEFFFLVNEIRWDLPWMRCLVTKRHLSLDLSTLFFSPWEGVNVVFAHEVK